MTGFLEHLLLDVLASSLLSFTLGLGFYLIQPLCLPHLLLSVLLRAQRRLVAGALCQWAPGWPTGFCQFHTEMPIPF